MLWALTKTLKCKLQAAQNKPASVTECSEASWQLSASWAFIGGLSMSFSIINGPYSTCKCTQPNLQLLQHMRRLDMRPNKFECSVNVVWLVLFSFFCTYVCMCVYSLQNVFTDTNQQTLPWEQVSGVRQVSSHSVCLYVHRHCQHNDVQNFMGV